VTAPPSTDRGRRIRAFIATKEHRRFTEFADAVRREGHIGLCYGPAGVGKTVFARRHAHWDTAESLLQDWGPRTDSDPTIYSALNRSRTVFYTPAVRSTHKTLVEELQLLTARVDICIDQHLHNGVSTRRRPANEHIELIVIDEADRLSAPALEHLRDRFDRQHLGLLLIGMPGIEKRLAAYPQLYSRIGFAHQYRPLNDDELTFVLTRHWRRLGLSLSLDDFTDAQAIAAVGRVTRDNFRLIQRLFTQVERVMKINGLQVITLEVIEAARSTLVIGAE
jgi:DNA transposition AAA+ family ATPase